MSVKKGILVKEIDRVAQDKIFISAYWRQRNVDEKNIGYGRRKDNFILQIVGVLFTLLSRIVGWFVEPKVRHLMKPWVRFALLLLPSLVIGILINRGRTSVGFYQLDNEGRPVLFLSSMPPEEIQGRIGASRKRFLSE